MLLLALKNLIQERTKLFISIGGIAAVLVLILVINGVIAGMEGQITAYIDKSQADIWVMQKGVSNMHMANTRMPLRLRRSIAQLKGVKDVSAILYINGMVKVSNRKFFSYVVGFNPNEAAGGPWRLGAGKKNIKNNEVILDATLARNNNLKIGDKVEVLGKELTIAGLSEGTFSMANTVTFLNRRQLANIIKLPGVASYFLVSIKSNIKADTVSREIENKFPGVNVVGREKLVANDRRLIRQMGIDIINAMSLIAFIIGIIVLGLSVYTLTVDKSRDYGILKAVGINIRQLYKIVFLQAFISVAMGLVVGLAISTRIGSKNCCTPFVETACNL